MSAKKLMVHGSFTGSGKSLLVSILCRIFREDGHRVAPFKLLNWTGVVYKDAEGREFGYSQALQCEAAGIPPDYRCNPFTPKTMPNGRIDYLIEGRVAWGEYRPLRAMLKGLYFGWRLKRRRLYKKAKEAAERCFKSLSEEFDIIVMEGSGPANLPWRRGGYPKLIELANRWPAETFNPSVVLIGPNVEFAPPLLSRMSEKWRANVRGLVLNPFTLPRLVSDLTGENLEREILSQLEKVSEVPVLGFLPYFPELSKLPPLDPILWGEKIPLRPWGQLVAKMAAEARKSLDLEKIYSALQ